FIQRKFVLQVQLVIEIGTEAVLMSLAILRHHDDGRLQCEDHVEHKVEQNERVLVERTLPEQQCVGRDPQDKKPDRAKNEFPTATKFCDHVRGAIRECKLRLFFDINIAGGRMAQKFIGAPQSISECSKHFQRDVRAATQEGKKMLARKYSQPCILCNDRIG